MPQGGFPPIPIQALAHVDAYHRQVQDAKREEETKRDQALMLVVGGALTLSFQLVAALLDKGALVYIVWLAAAWIIWALALIAALLSYSLSIEAHQHILMQLGKGNYDPSTFACEAGRRVSTANNFAIVGTIIGFFLFGIFALRNLALDRTGGQTTSGETASVQGEEKGKNEGVVVQRETLRDTQRRDIQGIKPTGAAAGLPAAKKEGENTMSNEREVLKKSAPPPDPPPSWVVPQQPSPNPPPPSPPQQKKP